MSLTQLGRVAGLLEKLAAEFGIDPYVLTAPESTVIEISSEGSASQIEPEEVSKQIEEEASDDTDDAQPVAAAEQPPVAKRTDEAEPIKPGMTDARARFIVGITGKEHIGLVKDLTAIELERAIVNLFTLYKDKSPRPGRISSEDSIRMFAQGISDKGVVSALQITPTSIGLRRKTMISSLLENAEQEEIIHAISLARMQPSRESDEPTQQDASPDAKPSADLEQKNLHTQDEELLSYCLDEFCEIYNIDKPLRDELWGRVSSESMSVMKGSTFDAIASMRQIFTDILSKTSGVKYFTDLERKSLEELLGIGVFSDGIPKDGAAIALHLRSDLATAVTNYHETMMGAIDKMTQYAKTRHSSHGDAHRVIAG